MTSFALKIIALISMFCDHFGNAYLKHFSIFNLIGRIAFPIFAFQISEGYVHTKNLKKYFLRLGIFALVSQIPFSLFLHKFLDSNLLSLNVFFTLFLGLLAIYLYDYVIKIFKKYKKNKDLNNSTMKINWFHLDKIIGLIIVILIAYIAQLLNTDYGAWGVILVFAFYIFKDKKILRFIAFTLLVIIKYLPSLIQSNFHYIYILMTFSTLLPILFIDLYNGKQGKKIKYLLYWFYPIHLLLLYLIF